MKILKILIIFCALLTLAIVYAPQPITPLLSNYFNVSLHQISWVISITLIPLAVAPLIYGYLLEIFSLKKNSYFFFVYVCIFWNHRKFKQ